MENKFLYPKQEGILFSKNKLFCSQGRHKDTNFTFGDNPMGFTINRREIR